MNCSKCGAALNENSKFCTTCGTPQVVPPAAPVYTPPPQTQMYSAPPYNPPPQGAPPASAGKGGKPLSMKIAIPIAAVALLLAIFSGLWLFTGIFTFGKDGATASSSKPPEATASPSPTPAQPTPASPSPTSPSPSPTPTTPTPESPSPMRPAGYYSIVAFGTDGMDLLELYEAMGIDIDGFYIEFMSDGRFMMVMFDEVSEGTFSVAGNTIKLTASDMNMGTEIEGTIEGDTIIFDMDGARMEFERNPGFVPPPIPSTPEGPYEPWNDPTLRQIYEGETRITEKQAFRFVPDQPGLWEFMTSDSGSSDPSLRIYDMDGNELEYNDDFGDLGFDALISIYLNDPVIVEVDFWGLPTTTTLIVTFYDVPVWDGLIPPDGGIIEVWETTFFSFAPDRDGIWVFYTTNSGSDDPYLSISYFDGGLIMEDDDGLSESTYDALLIVYLESGQAYSVYAGFWDGDAGYFELVVKPPERIPDNGGTIQVSFPQGFEFRPDQSGTWEFRTSNNGVFDPYLVLADEDGIILYTDNDGGDDLNSLLTVDLIAGEVYNILASFIGSDPGTYTLTVTRK